MGATLETINTARKLVEALNSARNDRDVLAARVNNPVCGKPGHGFKAMRKLRPLLVIADANVKAIELEINIFLSPPKTNFKRREARLELWRKVCAEWGM